MSTATTMIAAAVLSTTPLLWLKETAGRPI
jgi:hypothetical protein